MLLSSEDIRGAEAERLGYVNRALPDAELDNFVDAVATRIASLNKWAIANTKRLVNEASLPPDVEIRAGFGCLHGLRQDDQQPRKESKPSWSRGSRNLETHKADSDSIWDSSASRASTEIRTAYPTLS